MSLDSKLSAGKKPPRRRPPSPPPEASPPSSSSPIGSPAADSSSPAGAAVLPTHQGFVRSSDGVQLFYRVIGEGEPALVCCNGVGVSTFFWRYVVERFAPRHKVVVWDYRGHGRSQSVSSGFDLSMEQSARDLRAVCEAVGVEKPILLGHSMGAQVALEHYRRFPRHTAGLVSILGTFGQPLHTFGNLNFSRTLFDVVLSAALGSRGRSIDRFLWRPLTSLPFAVALARLLGVVHAERCSPEDLRPYLAHLEEIGAPMFFSMVLELGEHTAWDVLPSLKIPTLIIAGGKDGFCPPHLSRKAASLIPHCDYEMYETATHAGIVEFPAEINERLDRFLEERFPKTIGKSA